MSEPTSAPLIVVAAHNEAGSVQRVVATLRDHDYAVCVVDDGSTDATGRAAAEAGAIVLRLPVNLGVGGALRAGFRYALANGHDTVVQVDADGQHDPELVSRLTTALAETGADMVIGSRFAAGGSSWTIGRARRLAMRILAWRASRTLSSRVTDATSGFRAIRGRLLRIFADSYPVEYLGDTVEALIIAGRAGAKVVEVPVAMPAREHGRPSAGPIASLWYLIRVMVAVELMRPGREPPPALPNEGRPVT